MEKGEERLDKYLDRPNCLIVVFLSKLCTCNGNHVLSVKGGGELHACDRTWYWPKHLLCIGCLCKLLGMPFSGKM